MRIQINKIFSCFTNRACDDYFGGDIFKNGVDVCQGKIPEKKHFLYPAGTSQ